MGLFGILNKISGYTEENMIKCFDQLLTPLASQALCSIGVSLKTKTLFSSKAIASGFAAITNTNILVLYTIIPVKSAALYDFHSPKKLTIQYVQKPFCIVRIQVLTQKACLNRRAFIF